MISSFPLMFWIVVIVEGLMVFGYFIAFPFLATYLSMKSYDATYVGFYFSVVMFILSLGNSFGGSWSDYVGRK